MAPYAMWAINENRSTISRAGSRIALCSFPAAATLKKVQGPFSLGTQTIQMIWLRCFLAFL